MDYDALAKKYGGSVSLDSLAAKYGGSVVQEDTPEEDIAISTPKSNLPSSYKDPTKFAEEQGKTGVMIPAQPSISTNKDYGWGDMFKDTGKIFANAASDVASIGKELFIKTPKRVFYDIPKEGYQLLKEQGLADAVKNTYTSFPDALAGTVWNLVPESAKQLGGKENWNASIEAWQELLHQNGGSWSKAFGQALKAESLPETGNTANQLMLDNIDRARVSFIDHPISETLGYLGMKQLVNGVIDPKAGEAQIKKLATTAKDTVTDLVSEPIKTNPLYKSFEYAKKIYERNNRSSVLKDAQKNAGEAVTTIKNLRDVEQKIESVPKFSEQYNQLIRQRDQLVADKVSAETKVQADLRYQTNLISEDLKKSAYENPDVASQDIINTAQEAKQGVHSAYDQSFKTPDGKPIIVDTAPVLEPMTKLMSEASAAMQKPVFDKLRTYYGDFVIRKILAEKGGNIGEVTPNDLKAYREYLPDNFFTKTGEVNYDKIADPYYQRPITADNIKNIRNDIHDTLGNHGGLLKTFDDTVKASLNGSLAESVQKVNPKAWEQVEAADKQWQKIANSEISSAAAKPNVRADTIMKKIYDNWKEFEDNYAPEQVDKMRSMKAQEIIRDSYKGGKLDGNKFARLLEQNKEIVGPQLYSELSTVRDGFGSLEALSNTDMIKEVSAKAKEIQQKAQVIGDDIRLKVTKVKTPEELQKLAETSGLETETLGDIAIDTLYKKHNFNLGKGAESMDIKEVNALLADWKKIGGDLKPEIQNKMFRPELRDAFKQLDEANAEYLRVKDVKTKSALLRSVYAGVSLVSYMSGHYILGTGYGIQALKPNPLPGIESIKLGETPTAQTTPAVQQGLSKGGQKVFIGTAAGAIRREDYLQAAQELAGRPLTEEEMKELADQYDATYGDQ